MKTANTLFAQNITRRNFSVAAAGLAGTLALSGALKGRALADEALSFTAGTYTGTGTGNGGDIVVEVTFSDTALESIEVTSQSETPAVVGQGCIDIMTGRIVDAQSVGVDTVTGATATSQGIIDAVSDAATQADAPEAFFAAVESEPEQTEKELEADAIVIGAGGAGMSCVIRLEEQGKHVVLVEKTYRLGGSISVSGGNQVVCGSQLQKDCGVTEDTPEQMIADFQENGENLCNEDLISVYAYNVGEVTDWLNQDHALDYNTDAGLHQLAEYTYNRELAYMGGGYLASETLQEQIADTDAEVLTCTRATEIIVEDGKVAGIKASAEDGTQYTIKAPAVVLATGGYGNAEKWLTEDLAKHSLYYGLLTSTGDGLDMATAEGVDAATTMIEYAKLYPNGVEVSEHRAKSTIDGNLVVWPMSAILVSPEGERVVNEKDSNHHILEVEQQQTNSMLYLLMDAENWAVWYEKLPGTGFNMKAVEGYLEANGSSSPVFAHADTLEELAGLVGMDAAVLTQTVEDYNAGVEAGEDEFGRTGDYLQMKIGEGPYYLVEQKPRYATTMGGLVVNSSLEVQNNSGVSIEGLFAAGEVVGAVMGSNSPSGANNGWALTSGKLAADTICA